MSRVSAFAIASVLCVLATAPANAAGPAATEAAWENLFTDEGITVWRREIPGTSLVEFRGKGKVDASVLRLAALIRDDTRKTEWMKNCAGASTLQYKSPGHSVVYNRTGSPVPLVSDRDIVLEAKTSMLPKQKLMHIEFTKTEHPSMPVIDGVVRMPELKGFWKLRQVNANLTEVTYQVQADPGGLLPKWLVNWVNKKLPFHTINNMRAQSKMDGYSKHEVFLAASLDWTGFDIPAALR